MNLKNFYFKKQIINVTKYKNMYKNIIKAFFAIIFVLGSYAGVSYAQEMDIEQVIVEIQELRFEQTELRLQIEAGEITREEAQDKWQERIDEIRLLKDEVFEEKTNRLQERYKDALEKNPDRAETMNNYINTLHENRVEMSQKRKALGESLFAEEITREEAQLERVRIRESFNEELARMQNLLNEDRLKLQENFQEKKELQQIQQVRDGSGVLGDTGIPRVNRNN